MKVAIVGCGNIAATHAKALIQQNQEIVLVIGRDQSKAKAFAEIWNIPSHSNQFTDALASSVDCIHICTPPAMHYEMAKAALLAGKHVICEKPLCLNSEQARELYQLAEERGLLAAVNFNVRYHEACQRGRKIVATPGFGAPRLIHGSYLQEFHILPAQYMWRYIPEFGGLMRAVTEIGSHWIDLVRFWTGLEITAVSASFGCFHKDRYKKDGMMFAAPQPGSEHIIVESEDAAVVSLQFSNGAIGSLLLSEVSHGRSNCIKIEISSDENSVWWCSETPYQIYTAQQFKGVTSVTNAFGGGFPDTFSSFFEEVNTSLQSGKAGNYPSFYDGYQNAAVCEAIYRSAKNHSEWTEVT